MKIYHSDKIDAFYNLALEEHILTQYQDDDYLLFWQSKNTVVIGRHQNLPEEIDLEYADKLDINIVRRPTGGGAVYHDYGNLNFSFISDMLGSSQKAMDHFTQPIVMALKNLALDAEKSGRNDIMISGKKVSGNAQRIQGQRILHHGTLLFDSDLSVLSQVLKVRPEKFKSKSAKSVRNRVANIKEFLKEPMDMAGFITYLMDKFIKLEKASLLKLSPDDEKEIEKIKKKKFLDWKWNHGRSPKCEMRNMERFSGGFLEVYLSVRQGLIQECYFYGDFMSLRPAEDISKYLSQKPFNPEDVENTLLEFEEKHHPLEDYFGSISLKEVVHCIFSAK